VRGRAARLERTIVEFETAARADSVRRPPGGFGSTPAQRRHFLFVAAPCGPFSSELGAVLRLAGSRCSRVLLNGGDVCDWGVRHAYPYFGPESGWPAWLERTIEREGVTDLILYGDAWPRCAMAQRVGAALSLRVHVLEQGYFRPFWITLERDGVNANSRLPRDPQTYLREAAAAEAVPEVWLPPLTPPAVARIFVYHFAQWLAAPIFQGYRSPYAYSPMRQFFSHTRRFIGHRLSRTRHEQRLTRALDADGPIFLAVLQRPGDSQLIKHSAFPDQTRFIETVVESFAANAPAGARLIVKSHPLDHGIVRHEVALARLARVNGVADRVFFCDKGDLDLILSRVAAVVTINSTAGLAAIGKGVPTLVLGDAFYDMPGLTHRGGLDRLWTDAEPPVAQLYQAFRRVVMARTQVNGAYATRRGVALAVPEVARRLINA
jgi:capsular polysaccharide export protein